MCGPRRAVSYPLLGYGRRCQFRSLIDGVVWHPPAPRAFVLDGEELRLPTRGPDPQGDIFALHIAHPLPLEKFCQRTHREVAPPGFLVLPWCAAKQVFAKFAAMPVR